MAKRAKGLGLSPAFLRYTILMSMERMRRGGKKENGPENKKDHRRNALRFALAAIGALNADPSPAAQRDAGPPAQQATIDQLRQALTPYYQPQRLARIDESPWVTAKLKEKTLNTDDVLKIEDSILSEKVDLSLQIKFLQRAFRPDGPYRKSFEDPALDMERFSAIIRTVDAVSTRLTQAYDKQTIQGFEYLFSSTLKTLQNSSRIMDKGSGYCNGFLYRDSVGAVRFETDGHCADAVHPDMRPYLTLARNTDAATMLVTPEMYGHLGITDDQDLPFLDPRLSVDKIIGQPVISYSYGPHLDLKVHYSIAMPWTESARKLAHSNNIDKDDPLLKDQLFMIKPPEEGKVLVYGKDGKVIRVGASGSSGSLVALPGKDGLRVIGSFVSVKVLHDSCRNVCYSLSNFNTPATHEALAKKDRAEKGLAMRH